VRVSLRRSIVIAALVTALAAACGPPAPDPPRSAGGRAVKSERG
jgi:hypothetical protein